jgi:hypothetical protein
MDAVSILITACHEETISVAMVRSEHPDTLPCSSVMTRSHSVHPRPRRHLISGPLKPSNRANRLIMTNSDKVCPQHICTAGRQPSYCVDIRKLISQYWDNHGRRWGYKGHHWTQLGKTLWKQQGSWLMTCGYHTWNSFLASYEKTNQTALHAPISTYQLPIHVHLPSEFTQGLRPRCGSTAAYRPGFPMSPAIPSVSKEIGSTIPKFPRNGWYKPKYGWFTIDLLALKRLGYDLEG